MSNNDYIILHRSYDIEQFICKYPNAFQLLSVIAFRARNQIDNSVNLDYDEAYIYDFKYYGLTRSKYRTAINVLIRLKLIQVRLSKHGLIAKLISSQIFDINLDF